MSGISNLTCDMNVFEKHTLHYCFFTAWCQLNSWYGFAHPWWAGEEIEPVFAFYDRLRYRLLPYIYSTAITANLTGMPVCRAMPLMFEDDALQNAVCEYMFGENLLVGAFSDEIYLPAGNIWIDYWSGKVYEGGAVVKPEIPDDRGGFLFVRGGAIIPTDVPRQHTNPGDTENIILELYPHGVSYYDFYEDDGMTLEYNDGKRAVTRISMAEADGRCDIGTVSARANLRGLEREPIPPAYLRRISQRKSRWAEGPSNLNTTEDSRPLSWAGKPRRLSSLPKQGGTKMLEITNTSVMNLENAMRGARNPLNSWARSDSTYDADGNYILGENDIGLGMRLCRAGSDHRKFIRQIIVSADITAPLYWWKEFDTYKVGTVANSTSTMHKIQAKEFSRGDFSHDHMSETALACLDGIIACLEERRLRFLETKDKAFWYDMIQLLPASYNQLRTVTLNYEVLVNIYYARRTHKLDEWHTVCRWIESLPYAKEFILSIGSKEEGN